ncbi:hypothetical protein [Cellulomonas palmilytica]|uniref:hypothetical protein n=1 Tax=Cellulomonas palmilytica TaxID=2608402 RepID=UPI001F1AFAD7|nr:hypothetical protein [Cellulomonas palmilytica]UJP39993.1 hypothetical protein F1D97_00015 [Cellulomonas palmilytica]
MRRRSTLALGLALTLTAALTACSSDETPQAAATTSAPTTAAAEPTPEPTPEPEETTPAPTIPLADALPTAADLGDGWSVVDVPVGEGLFTPELPADDATSFAPQTCHALSSQIDAYMVLASGAGEHADVLLADEAGSVLAVQLETVDALDAAELTAFEEFIAPCAAYTFSDPEGSVIEYTAATVDAATGLGDASTGLVATGSSGGGSAQLHLVVAHVGDVRVTTVAMDADEASVLTAARTAIAHLLPA